MKGSNEEGLVNCIYLRGNNVDCDSHFILSPRQSKEKVHSELGNNIFITLACFCMEGCRGLT